MAVIFTEGFDSYGGSTMQHWFKWNAPDTTNLAAGRFGGSSLINGSIKFLDAPRTGLTLGFAVNIPSGGVSLIRWYDGPNFIMDVGVNFISGLLNINNGSTVIYSTKPMPCVTWVYFEMSIADFGSTTAGNVKIRINGEQVLSSPGGFSVNAGNGTASGFLLRSAGGDQIYYDDLYVTDTTGPFNTGFLEDGEIITLFPNGPGSSTQFGVVGAATNWQALIDQPNDGDTSYVFSGTDTNLDLYTIPTIPVGNTFVIPAIVVNTLARRDSDPPIGFNAVVKSGSNQGSSATVQLGNSYSTIQGIFEREPVTNNPWNETLINSLEIGLEVVTS